jgi:serine beta-lactamase-like protein LACTB, mitochondrial
MKYTWTILLFTLFVSSNLQGQTQVKLKYREAAREAHRIIDSLRQAQKIPGMDAAISINGEVVWSEAFGLADVENNAPVISGKTRFRIGSVSKPLTAAAMGKLMDRGKLKLTSPVQEYVPYFPLKKYPITVKQVAGHLSGIRHYRGNEFLNRANFKNVKSSLKMFQDDSLLFEPGVKFSYSSYGFNLLSAVVEGASGEEFLRFMQREVFLPLKMTSTCADKNDSIIMNRTSFYQLDSLKNVRTAPYVDNSYKWAGGGFISTTADLLRFGEAHLKPVFFLRAH